jgi:hypothetical protein
MYCLLQFYFCTAERLKPKEPLLKLVAIKAVGTAFCYATRHM